MIIKDKGNVLVISDLHLPFEHKKALDFVKKVRDKYKCDVVIGIGDWFDNHAISYHDKDVDGLSYGYEIDISLSKTQRWVKEFPKAYQIYGNHGSLPMRKAKTHGLSKKIFKSYNEIFDLPNTWIWSDWFEKDDVRYVHGTSKSGKYAYVQWAIDNMQDSVSGHTHSYAGISYIASNKKLIYGMGVGCLVDKDSYGMEYGKVFAKKPILSCGVILDNGRHPLLIPMEL